MRSWATTIGGVLAGLFLIALGGLMLYQQGPGAGGWMLIGAGASLAGFGVVARDNRKTSEEAMGTMRAGQQQSRAPYLVLLAAGLLVVPGCGAVTTTAIDGQAGTIQTSNQGDSTATVTLGEGGRPVVTSKTDGINAGVYLIDGEGIWGGGADGTKVAWSPETNLLFLQSLRDVAAQEVSYTPQPAAGEPMFLAKGVTISSSAPLEVMAAAYADAVEAMEGMTRIEAEKQIQQWRTAGEISAQLAEVLLRAFVPTLPGGGDEP